MDRMIRPGNKRCSRNRNEGAFRSKKSLPKGRRTIKICFCQRERE